MPDRLEQARQEAQQEQAARRRRRQAAAATHSTAHSPARQPHRSSRSAHLGDGGGATSQLARTRDLRGGGGADAREHADAAAAAPAARLPTARDELSLSRHDPAKSYASETERLAKEERRANDAAKLEKLLRLEIRQQQRKLAAGAEELEAAAGRERALEERLRLAAEEAEGFALEMLQLRKANATLARQNERLAEVLGCCSPLLRMIPQVNPCC